VREIFTVSLREFLKPSIKQREIRTLRGIKMHVPYFLLHGHKVWGATSMILAEFRKILGRIITSDLKSGGIIQD